MLLLIKSWQPVATPCNTVFINNACTVTYMNFTAVSRIKLTQNKARWTLETSNFKQYNFILVITVVGKHCALTWISVSLFKQLITGVRVSLNFSTLTKSLLPSVSKMLFTTCREISWLVPVIEPELSTKIMTSFGLNEASMYHSLIRQSNMSTCESFLNTPENTQQSLELWDFHNTLSWQVFNFLLITQYCGMMVFHSSEETERAFWFVPNILLHIILNTLSLPSITHLVDTTTLISSLLLMLVPTGSHTHSNPDIAPLFVHHKLWQYTKGGGKSKHYVIGNLCSQAFMGTNWGWCCTRGHSIRVWLHFQIISKNAMTQYYIHIGCICC